MVESVRNSGSSLNRHRVLVVDDSVDSAMVLALALKLEGHISKTAYDGSSALEMAQSFRPDVILLDLGLPDMNGNEVALRIRSMPDLCQTILIAVSGYELDAEGLKAFDGSVIKPAEVEKILDLIAEVRARRT